MFSIFFQAGRMRSDFARFETEQQAKDAIANMVHRRYWGMPLRINLRNPANKVIYSFERK